MGEINARHGTRGVHGKALRQFNIGLGRHIENAEERRFFRMIRLRRIAGRRANACIALRNQVLARKSFIRGIAPKFAAHTLMQMLRKAFREAVT